MEEGKREPYGGGLGMWEVEKGNFERAEDGRRVGMVNGGTV